MLKIETGTENKILRNKSVRIEKISKEHLDLIEEMQETMIAEKGAGLAAPQVGRNIRLILTVRSHFGKKEIVAMINPEILERSTEKECLEEGCLSIPGRYAEITRPKAVTVKYLNLSGKEEVVRLKGMNARVVLHEVDHLDGILFVDYLDELDISPLDRLKAKFIS